MARLALVVLLVALAAICNAEESAMTLRRGDTATVVEEDASMGRRQLFGWGWLLFHLGAHPVDCCKPKPPIGPPRHEWERICPDLGCQSSDSETYTSESSAEESAVSSSTGGSTPTSASALSYWPLAVAALAASTALAAAIFGQRREQEGKHQLRGSVARRMEDFSSFADRTLADGGGGGKGVEMAPTTSATSSAGYRLA